MRDFLHALKSRPCADCGGVFHPVAMDFDHRPGERRLFHLGDIGWRSLDAIKIETEKCDIVCANCHRLRTYKRGQHLTVAATVTEDAQLSLLPLRAAAS